MQADGDINANITRIDGHEVFLVMMNHKERYALDLTHAQFGHRDETLMPWRTYVDIRVQSNTGEHPLGWTKRKSRKIMFNGFGEKGLHTQNISDKFGEVLTKAVSDFQRDSEGWIRIFKTPDDGTYHNKVQQVMQFVATRIDAFIDASTRNGFLKAYGPGVSRKALAVTAERDHKAKLDSWGEDGRGSSFKKAMEAIKARQAKEKNEWKKDNEITTLAQLRGLSRDGHKSLQNSAKQTSASDQGPSIPSLPISYRETS